MIVSRTPFRVSFFGGGTDYPAWYRENGGAVLATTINKYCYISVRYLPPFFDHKSRIVWSKVEAVKDTSEIQHPAVREVLSYLDIEEGVEIHHDGDLPARTGLGSSSSFTVGLLNALYALQGKMQSKRRLALEAIHIEQDRLEEHVGAQDQISAAFGGFNRIDFTKNGEFRISPIVLPRERLRVLEEHLMLFFTGFSRTASEIVKEQLRTMSQRRRELQLIHQMVDEAMSLLQSSDDLLAFGDLLHEAWQIKRSLTNRISSPQIDTIYDTARRAGAIGGKLLGAGGGGFMLFFVRPEEQAKVRRALARLLYVPIQFETSGSQIIFYDPDNFYRPAEDQRGQRMGERHRRAARLRPAHVA